MGHPLRKSLMRRRQPRRVRHPPTSVPVFVRNSAEAFGCPAQTYNTFQKQLNCGANTMADRFSEAPTMPYFYPGTTPNGSIRHFVYNPQIGSLGYRVVGFRMHTKGPFALYKYTPHTTTSAAGGGNYLFEQIWLQYLF